MSTFNVGSEVVYQGVRMKVIDGAYNGAVTLVDLNDASAMCQVPVQDVILAPHVVKPLTQFDLAEWHGLERLAGAAREIIAAPTAQVRKMCYEKHVLALGCCKRTLERVVKKIMAFDSIRALAAEKSGRPTGTRYRLRRSSVNSSIRTGLLVTNLIFPMSSIRSSPNAGSVG